VSQPPDAIALAERVLAILEEGSFSATYKFALRMTTDRHPREDDIVTEGVVVDQQVRQDPRAPHG
jgi:hypothetical protein